MSSWAYVRDAPREKGDAHWHRSIILGLLPPLLLPPVPPFILPHLGRQRTTDESRATAATAAAASSAGCVCVFVCFCLICIGA